MGKQADSCKLHERRGLRRTCLALAPRISQPLDPAAPPKKVSGRETREPDAASR